MIEVFFTDRDYELRSVYSHARGVTKDRIIFEAKKRYGRAIDVLSVVGYYHSKHRPEFIKDNFPYARSEVFNLDPILEPEPYVENHNTM